MLEKGTVITCPQCHQRLAQLTQDLSLGDPLLASSFQSLNNHPIENGQIAQCPKCQTPYFYNGKLHTERGWRP